MKLHRPEPILRCDARPVRDIRRAADALLRGEPRLVTDRYGTAADVLEALADRVDPTTRRFREVAAGLVAPIEDGRVLLHGARNIGFLEDLYPELQAFWLPFIDIQGLSSAWERYRDGVKLAVVGREIRPFYGTYAPTRTEHLELFATWLSKYEGARGRAIDVGTGCGVLAMLLEKQGFAEVIATDTNPNAVESVRRQRLERVQVREADLLDGEQADLVVFNPPWVRGEVRGLLDQALFYRDPALFERFFDQALSSSTVVMLFSNIQSLVLPDEPHPIEAELARGRYRLVEKLRRKVKPPKGRRTKERVEVWVLAPLS